MGLAKFKNLFLLAGVLDEDYRGNVGVVLFNHSDQPFNISRGDRIAQLICQRIYYPELQEVVVSIIQFCYTYCFLCQTGPLSAQHGMS
jgi:dUTPase